MGGVVPSAATTTPSVIPMRSVEGVLAAACLLIGTISITVNTYALTQGQVVMALSGLPLGVACLGFAWFWHTGGVLPE